METHKGLNVWKLSINLVTEIYKITASFPKEEIFGIVSQMRRSAVSIPSNIAEGAARNHPKEFKQFLYIILGSASELNTQLVISERLGYIKSLEVEKLISSLEIISKMLQGLIRSIKSNS